MTTKRMRDVMTIKSTIKAQIITKKRKKKGLSEKRRSRRKKKGYNGLEIRCQFNFKSSN